MAQGVEIVYHRSSLQKLLEHTGKMLAVGMGYEAAKAFLSSNGVSPAHACIAAVNSPSACTLAGVPAVVEDLQQKLEAAGTFNRMLRVSIAFHSPLVEQIKDDFLTLQSGIVLTCVLSYILFYMKDISAAAPAIPFFSTVTGRIHEEKFNPKYWWSNMREPVLFNQAVSSLVTQIISSDKLR